MGPGPSQNGIPTLEPFLKAMDRLQSALEYFEKNNPQSVELENVVSIYNAMHDCTTRILNLSVIFIFFVHTWQ